MYGVVANYVYMSNFQLCYSPSTYLQTSVLTVCRHYVHYTYLPINFAILSKNSISSELKRVVPTPHFTLKPYRSDEEASIAALSAVAESAALQEHDPKPCFDV